MEAMQIYDFEGAEIRTVEREGTIWWVANDVCELFGETNRNRAMQALDDDEKGYTQMYTPGGMQNVSVVNEAGLYSILFAMQPEKARGVSDEYIAKRSDQLRRFRRWVTHDVLPSIRRHGMYATEQTVEQMLQDPDMLIQTLQALKAEREQRRQLENKARSLEQRVHEYRPKAQYVDEILKCPGCLNISQIAADYNMSAKALNALLHEEGIQYRQGGQWLLYEKYRGRGLTRSKTTHIIRNDGRADTVTHTQWTNEGRMLIHQVLKERGIVPQDDDREETKL